MSDTTKRQLRALGLFAFGLLLGVRLYAVQGAEARPLPAPKLCPEDAVIVGRGDYVGGQGWDTYVCTPLDDLTEEDK